MEVVSWFSDNAEWLFGGVGVVVLTALVKFVPPIGRWFAAKFIPSSSVVEVFPPKEASYNDEFYKHFEKCFREVKSHVYITGEGFECKDDEGEERARKFATMMRDALTRGVKIVRVETRPVGNEIWANELATLKRKFGDQFQHFVFGASSDNQLSSISVFDPSSSSDCIVEIMLSVSRRFGTDSGSLAGPGIFIYNEPELAKNMADRIVELTQLPDVSESRDADHLKDLLSGKSYYFAYGSNMDSQQMVSRIPSAKKVGVGTLEKYALKFNRHGSYRDGGVASIEPSDDRVIGIVWELATSDLGILTEIEDPRAYDRVFIDIKMKKGDVLCCNTYVARKQADFIAPEKKYIDLIIKGAVEAKIDEEYINSLREIPVHGEG